MKTEVIVSQDTFESFKKLLAAEKISQDDLKKLSDARVEMLKVGWDKFLKIEGWDVREHKPTREQKYKMFSMLLNKKGKMVTRAYCKVTHDNKIVLTKVEITHLDKTELETL